MTGSRTATTVADIYAAAELILELDDIGEAVTFVCQQLGCSFSPGYGLVITAASENRETPLGRAFLNRAHAPIRLPPAPRVVLGPVSV